MEKKLEEIKKYLQSDKAVKWLFYGDSITHGVIFTYGMRDYTQLFAERIRYELGRDKDIVINTASSGDTVKDLVAGFDWRVRQFNPDVLFLMIGINDCSDKRPITFEEFEKGLRELVDMIDELGTKIIIQTTSPVIHGAAPEREPYFDKYMDAIRRIAKDKDLPLIDHAKYWYENQDKHFMWMANSFHPNAYGHQAFVNLLFRELGIYDPESPTCRLFLP